MEIEKIQVSRHGDLNELSGWCGNFKLWYRFPREFSLEVSADPFLAACLLPAMANGKSIRIKDSAPVSKSLLDNIEHIQNTFHLWNGYYKKHHNRAFKKVSIKADNISSIAGNDLDMAFFSGGVDGLDTFLRNAGKLDCLLFAKGIDFQLDNPVFDEALRKNRAFLDLYEKKLWPVETNVRFLGHHYGVGWQSVCAGSGLSSIAMAGGFRKCYIASSNHNGAVYPEGSNYITDPMWSNGHTEVIHDGADYLRTEKIRYIFEQAPEARKMLRVCWQDLDYNCGSCGKCLRTMASLRLLGLSADTLPPITKKGLQTLKASRFFKEDDMVLFRENIELARQMGDREMLKALLPPVRKFYTRKLLKDAANLLRGH